MDMSTNNHEYNHGFHNLRMHTDAEHPGITLGLMLPAGPELSREEMVPISHSVELAQQAESGGFRGIWVRDVPLAIPQGLSPEHQQAVYLDDPFLMLGAISQATSTITVGTAATILPLRHPLHVAKSALTLDRLSEGRFVLGIGSGDRPEEFTIFDKELDARRETIRQGWTLLRAALSTEGKERAPLLEFTGGHAPATPPPAKIPLIAVGSARQTIQWIVRNADGWATYYRPAEQQVGRLDLWNQARATVKDPSNSSPLLISSMSLDLDAHDSPTSRDLVAHLHTMRDLGIDHVILNIGDQPAEQAIDRISTEVLPHL